MRTSDIFRLAFLNLRRRLSRTLLTVVGVVIGTACIVAMVAIGLTNFSQFNEMLGHIDLTTVEVMRGPSAAAGVSGSLPLSEAAVTAFAAIDGVERIIPQIDLPLYAATGRYHAPYLTVTAVPADALTALSGIGEGRCFREDAAMPELVMGAGAARNFIRDGEDDRRRDGEGPDLDWLDIPMDIYLGGVNYYKKPGMPSSRRYKADIVGILEDEGEEYPGGEIYMSLDAARRIIRENYRLSAGMGLDANTYDRVLIVARSMDDVAGILDIVRGYGFEAYGNNEWISDMQGRQRAQQGQLAAIGLVSLIVSAIGIANTMMTGILERRREIGVMKVIGVPIRRIRTLFLVESAFIGLTGGLLGVLLSHLFASLLASGGAQTDLPGLSLSAGMRLVMPLWLDAAAVGLAVFVGTAAGALPARRAVRLSPMEAMRS